jgi:hypothetical protein
MWGGPPYGVLAGRLKVCNVEGNFADAFTLRRVNMSKLLMRL